MHVETSAPGSLLIINIENYNRMKPGLIPFGLSAITYMLLVHDKVAVMHTLTCVRTRRPCYVTHVEVEIKIA